MSLMESAEFSTSSEVRLAKIHPVLYQAYITLVILQVIYAEGYNYSCRLSVRSYVGSFVQSKEGEMIRN